VEGTPPTYAFIHEEEPCLLVGRNDVSSAGGTMSPRREERCLLGGRNDVPSVGGTMSPRWEEPCLLGGRNHVSSSTVTSWEVARILFTGGRPPTSTVTGKEEVDIPVTEVD